MISNAAFTELRDLLRSGESEKARDLLLALQAGYFTLMEEIQHLQLRVHTFEELLPVAGHVCTRNGLGWIETEAGLKGPFCPLCHSTDGSLIRLEDERAEADSQWHCPSCEAHYPHGCPDTDRHRAVVLPFQKTCRLSLFLHAAGTEKGRSAQRLAGSLRAVPSTDAADSCG